MQSFFHCFWTGPSFPYGLRLFIKKWSLYLRKSKSDFELIVWLTDDALAAFESYMAEGKLGATYNPDGWKGYYNIGSLRFNLAKLNFNRFYVSRFEDLLREHHRLLQKAFKLLKNNKRYTSAGNLARLMIVDKCGGIYSDIDYLWPNEEKPFPKDIFTIIKVFKRSSSISLYMACARLSSYDYLMENQCVILAPAFKGHLRELFDRIDLLLDKAYMSLLITEAESEWQYQENEVTKRLNSSMFNDPLEVNLLRAYRHRSYTRFNYENIQLYRREILKGVFSIPSKKLKITDPAMLQAGMRHVHYDITGLLTYGVVMAFFQRHLKFERKKYYEECYEEFMEFFDKEHILSQFQFVDLLGEKYGMYSWANPGYGRLVKLEKAVMTVERYYEQRGAIISKSVLLNFIQEIIQLRIALEPETRGQLGLLIHGIMQASRNYLRVKDAKKVLRLVFEVLQISLDAEILDVAIREALRFLNSVTYKRVKDLIDPEKATLTEQDILDFCIM